MCDFFCCSVECVTFFFPVVRFFFCWFECVISFSELFCMCELQFQSGANGKLGSRVLWIAWSESGPKERGVG